MIKVSVPVIVEALVKNLQQRNVLYLSCKNLRPSM